MRVFALVVLNVLVLSAPAYAQSDVEGYGGQAGQAETQVGNAGGVLAFTGVELILLVAIALMLLVSGYTLRRLTTPRGASER